MPFRCRLVVMAACLAIASPAVSPLARAESVEQVLTDFGLMGRWAADCTPAPGKAPLASHYTVMGDGKVMRLLDFGQPGNSDFDYTVVSAERIAPDQVAMHLVNAHDSFDIVMQMANGRSRSYQSKKADGTVVVKDGIMVKSGTAMAWQYKCPAE
jgi:hypothetical protein